MSCDKNTQKFRKRKGKFSRRNRTALGFCPNSAWVSKTCSGVAHFCAGEVPPIWVFTEILLRRQKPVWVAVTFALGKLHTFGFSVKFRLGEQNLFGCCSLSHWGAKTQCGVTHFLIGEQNCSAFFFFYKYFPKNSSSLMTSCSTNAGS